MTLTNKCKEVLSASAAPSKFVERCTPVWSTHIYCVNNVPSSFAYLIGFDVHFMQIQIYCCKANQQYRYSTA